MIWEVPVSVGTGLRRRRILRRLVRPPPRSSRLPLHAGDRVAVIGGGPAGSFFSVFLLRLAGAVGLDLEVDVFEPRHFGHPGPGGCNHCGGVVSESLVQVLASEGIVIPPAAIETAIDSYVIHMDVGSVRLRYMVDEERIASLYRGNGPRGGDRAAGGSLDGHLLGLATDNGARHRKELVCGLDTVDGLPALVTADGRRAEGYHLVAVAAGVNSNLVPLLRRRPEPRTMRTYICEFRVETTGLREALGRSMHVFLLDLPGLEFAALVPKGEMLTLCVLGHGIDEALIRTFLDSPVVRRCLPQGEATPLCSCSPLINVSGARPPFADRVVYIGDAGVTRLYKDGIGAAFRTAKAAAETAVLAGVADEDFREHYLPTCAAIERDNRIGSVIFGASTAFKKLRFARRAILGMTTREQRWYSPARPMSMVMWNLFTGSAPYRAILGQMARPSFVLGFVRELVTRGVPRWREGVGRDVA